MVEIKNKKIYIDGKETLLSCGAIHYFRVMPEQWEDRLLKLKALGCNTVETYCCWNRHEPREGVYDFSGMLDLDRFLTLAEKIGLYAIVRPGPYICSEWDLGGLPAWLLKNDSIQLRSCQKEYFDKAIAYMQVLMKHIIPHLETNGGNVVMIAAENEYGSFSNSHKYMEKCVQLLLDCGVDVPIFTADGHTEISTSGGTVPGVLVGLNFGFGNGILDEHIAYAKESRPNDPIFHTEHWIGGTIRWKRPAPTYPKESVALEVAEQLERGINFDFYMFHGGTNWGFFNGANNFAWDTKNRTRNIYYSDATTYDGEALLNEYGDITPKYLAVQEVFSKYYNKALPIPERVKTQSLGQVKLNKEASLFDNLDNIGTRFSDEFARNMEHYDQDYGYILYRCNIDKGLNISLLAFERVYDRFHIYFNGIERGIIERNDEKQYLEVDGWLEEGGVLEILVENQGRVNFGPDMLYGDRKGICGYVYIQDRVGVRQVLSDWEIYTLPMRELERLKYSGSKRYPLFLSGTFSAKEKKDCFIHLDNFTKGFVVVNGFNLGRFWNVGPQKSLYLPWPLLKEKNEIIVFEEENVKEPVVSILDYHIVRESDMMAGAEKTV